MILPGLDALSFALLFIIGIAGGAIGAISGGSGLIITPVLLFAGLSPVQAIATQTFYAVPLLLSATWKFWQKGHIPNNDVVRYLPVLFVFGALGALSISVLPASFLKIFIPVLLIGLSVWMAANPSLESRRARPRLSSRQYGVFVLPLLAFYDGFVSTCATTFYTMGCVFFLNLSIIKATAVSKPFVAASSMAAFIIFALNGNIAWAHGVALGLGSIIGAQIGASMAIKHGARLIRIVLVVTSVAASLKLLVDQARHYGVF